MEKKISLELDVNVKGLGCKKNGNGFTDSKKKELSKVFSGEDFSL